VPNRASIPAASRPAEDGFCLIEPCGFCDDDLLGFDFRMDLDISLSRGSISRKGSWPAAVPALNGGRKRNG
jgi:hypothetical protein